MSKLEDAVAAVAFKTIDFDLSGVDAEAVWLSDVLQAIREHETRGPAAEAVLTCIEQSLSKFPALDTVRRLAAAGIRNSLRKNGYLRTPQSVPNQCQLPEGMEHCTIRFKKCAVGHGRLVADNWIDNGCLVCERNLLRGRLSQMLHEQPEQQASAEVVERVSRALQPYVDRDWRIKAAEVVLSALQQPTEKDSE